MTDEELMKVVGVARELASKVGPMHAMWDVISDAEGMVTKKWKPIIDDRDHIEQTLLRFIGRTSAP